ncbi:MAG: PD-(D/E)XK nuclease family protein, partial [Verrucomicrobiota bacterium]
MKVQFLLGPAGSGKTFECLAQVRAALSASAEGPPLLFLAPKQATFQLERQLLADAALPGYTRLKILSFERLAQFVLEESLGQEPALLSAEGRLMVLRALLFRKQNDLKLFRSTARLSGFVEELSGVLQIFQQHEIAPAKLRALLENGRLPPELHAKLHDFSLLLHAYLDWLSKHEIQDEACLLDCATALLRGLHPGLEPSATTTPADQLVPLAAPARKRHTKRRHKASADSESQLMLFDDRSHRPARESSVEVARPHGPWPSPLANLHFAGLWLDGFAEMSSQEIALLSALVPLCDSATLAFCLDAEPAEEPAWLSTWAIIGQTCRRVYHQLAAVQSIEVETRILPRVQEQNRFSGALPLAHLEQFWIEPRPFISDGNEPLSATIRAVLCRNPEAECVLAAREILRHVQAGGRFRDVAVLVRKLDAYADSLRRIFTGYGIPFFLDQRESAAHHPLAELTRYTLRTLAFGWEREDWFGALKTGLLPVRDEEIDRLENIALERGWSGQVWLDPLVTPDDPDLGPSLESLRQTLVGPFQSLAKHLGRSQWPHAQNASEESPIPKRLHPTGQQVADGLRAFWEMLCVENTLQAWADTASAPTARAPDDKSEIQRPQLRHLIHETVWTEMNRWIDNVALAFSDLELPLREWLPILEAGLSHLSIGVIPPALDQVLIGAIDRSRQPDLQFAIVLGMNESVFPAPPPQETLLTDRDRAALEANQIYLGPGLRHRLGHERFYAYIALTRARRRLLLTASRFDFDDRSINPSPILDHLKRMFPEMQLEEIDAQPSPGEWFHPIEVLPLLLRARIHGRLEDTSAAWASFANVPGVKDFLERFKSRGTAASDEHLAPGIAEQLFGPHDLQTSVSRIEQFAACPFRFFVNSGLRVEERIQFEIDARERGSFQHEVLARFHTELQSEKRKWRDLQPAEARARIGQIAETIAAEYRLGLFLSTR